MLPLGTIRLCRIYYTGLKRAMFNYGYLDAMGNFTCILLILQLILTANSLIYWLYLPLSSSPLLRMLFLCCTVINLQFITIYPNSIDMSEYTIHSIEIFYSTYRKWTFTYIYSTLLFSRVWIRNAIILSCKIHC